MVSRLIRNLKTLFHNFIFYREDDEPNVQQWLNEHITYSNGVFENNSYIEQEISVKFVALVVNPYYRTGDIEVTVIPAVEGQQVTCINEQTTTTVSTNSNGFCRISGRYNRNITVTINVERIKVNGATYKGGSTTIGV